MKAIMDALNVVYEEKERRGLSSLSWSRSVLHLPVLVCFSSSAVHRRGPACCPQLSGLAPPTDRTDSDVAVVDRCHHFRLPGADRDGPSRREPPPAMDQRGQRLCLVIALGSGSALLSWTGVADYDVQLIGSLGAGIGMMMWMWILFHRDLVRGATEFRDSAPDGPRFDR